jgi:hypothetical protein
LITSYEPDKETHFDECLGPNIHASFPPPFIVRAPANPLLTPRLTCRFLCRCSARLDLHAPIPSLGACQRLGVDVCPA